VVATGEQALRARAPDLTPSPPQAAMAIQKAFLMQALRSDLVSEPAG